MHDVRTRRRRTKLFVAFTLTLLVLFGWITLSGYAPRPHSSVGLAFQTGSAERTSRPDLHARPQEPDRLTQARINEAYGNLPLHFEANRGQTDNQVKFLSRGPGYTLFLTPAEAVLALSKNSAEEAGKNLDALPGEAAVRTEESPRSVVRMSLVGANPAAQITGVDESTGKSSYFRGNDPETWQTDIPHYAKVHYKELYPGIDIVYYGNRRQLEYDFIVSPGADPERIKLEFEGARELQLDGSGNLVLRVEGGEIEQHRPVVYQQIAGVRKEVTAEYVIAGKQEVRIDLGEYDRRQELVIDPVLAYSTYLGGDFGFDEGRGIAVDPAGNAYITGVTSSADFPIANPLQPTIRGNGDAYVTKLSADGSALVYSTYVGGDQSDWGTAIAVDPAGNAYLSGYTDSPNFPTVNPRQSTLGGRYDAFITKVSPNGSALVYSTYLGSGGDDYGYAIAIDSSGSAYVTGQTLSIDFQAVNPVQPTYGGNSDVFISKASADGSALIYSTFLGGGGGDSGFGIAVDTSGNAYVTGYTESPNFPTANPLQSVFRGPYPDAFVTKLNASGSGLIYSTYLGGNYRDQGNAIAVDSAGSAYLTGVTNSPNFPTANPLQPTNGGLSDVYVTKLGADGSALIYSTYLGAFGMDEGVAIAVDSAGNAYVTGSTDSARFPTVNPLQSIRGGSSSDAFVTKLNANGSALLYSTFLGGIAADEGWGIAVDSSGAAYVTGFTQSNNFPTANPLQPAWTGGVDGFVAKIITDGVSSTPKLLWQHQRSGQIGEWLMNGLALSQALFFTPGQVSDTNWKIVGTADFNSDSKPDLVWQNRLNGYIGVWLMDGTTLAQSLYFTPEQVSDTNWKIVAVGDFNGDAKPDLVWQHQTEGYIGVWLMDGTTLAQAPFFTPGQVSDTNWKIVAVGDFNSDGKSDLVWDNRVNGYMGVWFMDGTTQRQSAYFNPVPLSDAGWQLVGVGDFNSDRKTDLVWQHQTSGSIAAWLMNGTNLLQPLYFTPDRISDTDWKIVGIQP